MSDKNPITTFTYTLWLPVDSINSNVSIRKHSYNWPVQLLLAQPLGICDMTLLASNQNVAYILHASIDVTKLKQTV